MGQCSYCRLPAPEGKTAHEECELALKYYIPETSIYQLITKYRNTKADVWRAFISRTGDKQSVIAAITGSIVTILEAMGEVVEPRHIAICHSVSSKMLDVFIYSPDEEYDHPDIRATCVMAEVFGAKAVDNEHLTIWRVTKNLLQETGELDYRDNLVKNYSALLLKHYRIIEDKIPENASEVGLRGKEEYLIAEEAAVIKHFIYNQLIPTMKKLGMPIEDHYIRAAEQGSVGIMSNNGPGMHILIHIPNTTPGVLEAESVALTKEFNAPVTLYSSNKPISKKFIKDFQNSSLPTSLDDPALGKQAAVAGIQRIALSLSVMNQAKTQSEVFLKLGHLLWQKFGHLLPQGDTETVKAFGPEVNLPGKKEIDDQNLLDLALIKWADSGFPTIRLGHKMAAALMTSRFDDETLADVKHPWSSFCIEVPDGLLSTKDEETGIESPIRMLYAFQIDRNPTAQGGDWAFVAYDANFVALWRFGYTPAMLVMQETDGKDYSNDFLPLSSHDQKISYLIGRFIVGICCVLTNIWENKAEGETLSKVNKGHHDKTDHAKQHGKKYAEVAPLVYKIDAPVRLDLRPRIAEYLKGKGIGKKLEVRTIVRGHWRSQPHGPNRSLRKSKWIYPFERGPKDAPMLVRTKVLEGEPNVGKD